MKQFLITAVVVAIASGCAHRAPMPKWTPVTEQKEAEYASYLMPGTHSLAGQAFLTQRGGGVVKAAGRTVTLDPATNQTGYEWWWKAGKHYALRNQVPNSPNFKKARRTVIADADGKFKFENLPAGAYYLRTEVTWDVPYHGIQGGLIGKHRHARPFKKLLLAESTQTNFS